MEQKVSKQPFRSGFGESHSAEDHVFVTCHPNEFGALNSLLP
jgi:hypothetical protein